MTPTTRTLHAVPRGIAVAVALLVVLSAAARAGTSSGPATLVETKPIAGFAQDGDRISWVTSGAPHREDAAVYVRDLRAGHTQTISRDTFLTDNLLEIAVASGRSDLLWSNVGFASDGSHEEYSVIQERPGQMPRLVEHWSSAGLTGAHVSGDGPTLAYLADAWEFATVKTVGGWRVHVPGAVDVAVQGTAVAVARPGAARCVGVADASPNGSLVVLFYDPGGCARDKPMFTSQPGLAEAPRPLAGRWRTAALSPDASSLALISGAGTLAVADAATRSAETRANLGRGAWGDLRWSPDGSFIGVTNGSRVVIVPTTGGAPRSLTGRSFNWSPDGAHLGVLTKDDRLAVAQADGSAAAPLSLRLGPDRVWQWQDASTLLGVVGEQLKRAVHAIGIDGTSSRRLFDVPYDASAMSFSRDGRRLEFESDFELAHMDVRTHKITRGQCSVGTACRWSPDGHHLFDPGFAKSAVDHVPGGRTELPKLERAEWTDDSAALVASTEGDDLYRVSADGRRHARIRLPAGAGRRQLVEIFGGAGRLAHRLELSAVPRSLAMDERSVAVLTSRTFEGSYLEIRSRGGRLVRRIDVDPTAGNVSLSGRWAVYTVGSRVLAVAVRTGALRVVARTKRHPINATIEGKRVAWAENVGSRGFIRAVELP